MSTNPSSLTIEHPEGGYRFLPGIAPYSGGVASAPGHEIVHVTLESLVGWRAGFERIAGYLAQEGRPLAALCALELRSPRPLTFPGFAAFNAEYASVLRDWGVFVGDVNPVARTNVAPAILPPDEPSLHAFSYTRPTNVERLTFVVAGAGELPEGVLEPSAIVAPGDVSRDGVARKADYVMDLMETRLRGLGGDWPLVTSIDIYTIYPFEHVLADRILGRAGVASRRGTCWHYCRPPIVDIEFEMDLRGVRTELLA